MIVSRDNRRRMGALVLGRGRRRQLGDLGLFEFTPGQVSDLQRSVEFSVESLNTDVRQKIDDLPADFVNGWARFRQEWRAFLADRGGWAARHELSTWEKTKEYRTRVEGWYKTFRELGGQPTGAPPPPPPVRASAFPPWAWGLLAVGGLFAVGRIVQSVTRR